MIEYIFEGKQPAFDLTKGQLCFQMNKNMSVSTLNEYKRRISIQYKEGKRDNPFPRVISSISPVVYCKIPPVVYRHT